MITKFFKHGKGNSDGVLNYMLGAKNDRQGARILEGSRQLTAMLIDSNPHGNKYKSGVLSFEEQSEDVSEDKKHEIMKSFEETIFCGLEREQYNILWVEHSDKDGRLELNFVIPRLDLLSGKAFNPYYHLKDEKRVNAWKNIVNIDNGFTDPTAPHKQVSSRNFDGYKPCSVRAEIEDKIKEGLESGNGTEDVRRILSDIEINGEKIQIVNPEKRNKSITVSHPTFKAKNNRVKLTGAMFQKDFNYTPPKKLTRSEQHKDELERVYYRATEVDWSENKAIATRKEHEQMDKERQAELLIKSRIDYRATMETATEYNEERYPPRKAQSEMLLAVEQKEQENANKPKRGFRS